MISSSSVQDVMDLTAVSYLSSIDNRLPVLNFLMDLELLMNLKNRGFRWKRFKLPNK